MKKPVLVVVLPQVIVFLLTSFAYPQYTMRQLTNNLVGFPLPSSLYFHQISDSGHVVWEGYDGSDFEIFLYDGTGTTALTHNEYYRDELPNINDDGCVVWQRTQAASFEDYYLNIFLAIPCSHDDDNDNDGYSSVGCGGDDCADFNPNVNPGMTEIPGNGLDDDCDPLTPAYPEPANTMAATHGRDFLLGSGVFNSLALLLIPVGGLIFLRVWRRRT